MKTSHLFGTAFVTLGVAVAPMFAQTQTTTSTSSTGYIQTSKLIGTKVKASQGEEIGVIKDVVLDRNTGCMAYTVLSAGGAGTRVTGQAKTVAIPWAVYSPSSDPSILMVRVDRDRIYNAPVFDYARIDEYGTTGYINNVYSYYGVSTHGGVGVSGGVSGSSATGTTTTTGATTATANPMASASPSATMSPARTASPGATAIAAPRATAESTVSPVATATPRSTPGASAAPTRGKARPTATPPSRRGTETTSPSTTGESPSESTTSPSESTKSPRHHRTQGTSKGEPSATPERPEEQE